MFEPKDFLELSRNLLDCKELDDNEALCRCVISRSYYAALLSAREKIDSINPTLIAHHSVTSHKEIENALCDINFMSQDLELPDDLADLKLYRIDADYHFSNACHRSEKRMCSRNDPDKVQTAEDCFKTAEKIIVRISKLV